MKFAILGLLVVLVIAFFVMMWKSAKNWRWYNLVAVFFIMALSITLLFPTSAALKSRSAWHDKKEELEARLYRAETEYKMIKFGDPDNPESEGTVQMSQRLSFASLEAGRRWPNLRRGAINNNSITLTKAVAPAAIDDGLGAAPAAAPAPAAPPSPLIPDGLVVYAFADQLDNATQLMAPSVYVGEMSVTASTPTQVTLTPTGQLNNLQAAQQAASWSIYEMLPLDSHVPFIAEGSSRTDENFFGRVDEDLVRSVLGQSVRETTIQTYLRDGGRLGDETLLDDEDPKLTHWTLIEFKKKSRFEVDSPDQRDPLDGGYFDGNGRAVDARLQVGGTGETQFEVQEQILLQQDAADELIKDDSAKLVDKFYLRPLNDYRYILRSIKLRLVEMGDRKVELEFEKKVLERAIEQTVAMIAVNQNDKLKLEQDLAQYQIEKKSIEEYTVKLRNNVAAVRKRMNELHRGIQTLESEIEQMHLGIERKLDAVTVVP